MSCLQVYQTDKQCNKHTCLVLLARQRLVHLCADIGRLYHLIGQRTEQSCNLSHKQRCGHSLTTHVAHAEVQFFVLKQIAIQVATNFLGRGHRCIHVQSLAVGEHAGQHTHLYVAGHIELALDRGLLCCGLLEFLDISYQRLLHITKRVAQHTYLIVTLEVGQLGVKLS